MKRAFILALDALFAISILAVFLTLFSTELRAPRDPYWLPQLGDNFMTSLDKNDVFYNIFYQGEADARATLDYYLATLPGNVNANITIKIYDLDGYPFRHRYEVHTQKQGVSPTDAVPPDRLTHIKRVFSSFTSMEYGIAELVIWYG